MELVLNLELLGLEEGLQTRDGSADGEVEIESSELTSVVDEGVDVLLDAEGIVEGTGALHDAIKVVVAAEEDVEAHLDVVAVLVGPGGYLATDVRAELEHLNVVAGIGQIHRGDHASEAGTDNADLELLLILLGGSVHGPLHQVGVEEGIVADLLLGILRCEGFVGRDGRHAQRQGCTGFGGQRYGSKRRGGCQEQGRGGDR